MNTRTIDARTVPPLSDAVLLRRTLLVALHPGEQEVHLRLWRVRGNCHHLHDELHRSGLGQHAGPLVGIVEAIKDDQVGVAIPDAPDLD